MLDLNTLQYSLGVAFCLLLILSIYFHFIKGGSKSALLLLLLSGLVLRLLMISLDPYLHSWDEKYHALVAKNLIAHPFKPMLWVNPILPYDVETWCCNHVWVHKQPLFLWQMALSLKIFGINEVAMRLPSAIMGTISIYFIYEISKKWTGKINVSYLAAFLFCVSFYQLEMTTGRISLDHNDVAFSFYVTGSIWAFLNYLKSNEKLKWAVWIGVFSGCAILIKWLTGFLVFGGWGLYHLLQLIHRGQSFPLKNYLIALATCLVVFVPWQLYITHAFPVETALMHKSNSDHIFKDLSHPGSVWFHLDFMNRIYGEWLIYFIPVGLVMLCFSKSINRKLSISMASMACVVYAFFSIIVKTKMPALVFPVNSIVWILIAFGIFAIINQLNDKFRIYVIVPLLLLVAYVTLSPIDMVNYRSVNNIERNNWISNSKVYKNIDDSGELGERFIINCQGFQDIDLMFYKDVTAYHWFPSEVLLDSILSEGHKVAAFRSHTNQHLPDYITDNQDIIIIDEELK